MKMNTGPIIACSTCLQSNAGLAVIRLSGFDSLSLLQDFFSADISKFLPRKQIHTNLLDLKGEILDDVLATFFPASHSFTGENVLELSVHGNIIHVERLLTHLTNNFGFSLAAPGEFTYRAFKNKKLNLSQVEGLDLLLSADTSFVFDQGLSQLTGELHQLYLELHQSFKKLVASVELSIDFSDDVGEEQAHSLFSGYVAEVKAKLSVLHRRCSAPIGSLLEPSIVFLGAPNAGTSTLFNHLLGHDRAIVSDVPGTTRDYLSESLSMNFGRVRLIDTAGIRAGGEAIEQEGIKRSRQQISHAFMRVLVVNPFDEMKPQFSPEDIDLVIVTHADVAGFDAKFSQFKNNCPNVPLVLWGHNESFYGPMGANSCVGPMGAIPFVAGPIEPIVYFSDPLRIISSLADIKYQSLTNSSPILIARQRELIHKLYSSFLLFEDLSLKEKDIAVLSSELAIILDISQELIGVFYPDDVLHHIFNNFCIGK
ncbi:MAG: hypothetical protein CME71_02435 [Halobacteriovorax sp.]|nr:hypothetical protein [Halobacteriovorax sp.]